MVNLDHNATTSLRPAAEEAMRRANAEAPGNPSSSHALGRKARQVLEDARERVAARLDCKADEIVFTSGATEANNLAVFGLAGAAPVRIACSPVEHPCVLEPVKLLGKRGWTIDWLPVDARGIVAKTDSGSKSKFTALMLANHETGAVQPVQDFATCGAVHCDAAQAVGKIPVSFRGLGVTTLSLSAHKFGGPKGIGALIVRKGSTLAPLMSGGHQQRGIRPGTEPVALVVGLAAALDDACLTMTETAVRLTALRRHMVDELSRLVPPVIVNGPHPGDADSLPTTLNLSFPGCRSDLLLMALDLGGVACSTGSACSSGSLLPSPVLQAMGVPENTLHSAMRFSLGAVTTAGEIEHALSIIVKCVQRLRSPAP